VLKRRKLKRGNPGLRWRGKIADPPTWMVLSWETLLEADKPMDGSVVSNSDWIGAGREKNLKFLNKGKRGMTVKPISWVPPVSKTSKGVKASEDDHLNHACLRASRDRLVCPGQYSNL